MESEPARWGWLWRGPGVPLEVAAADGEHRIARLRVTVVLCLLCILVLAVLDLGLRPGVWVSLACQLVALAHAGWILAVTRRRAGRAWIGFASAAGDATLVSLSLAGFVLAGYPSLATNHPTIFPVYFLVIASTALRYDTRVCVAAVLVSTVQYGVLVLWVYSARNLPHSPYDALPLSAWSFQAGRLILMLAAGWLSLHSIARAHRHCTLSTRDPLTGLLNRRFFDERLAEEAERVRRGESTLAVGLVDVDHFKLANDLFGHRVGDRALRAVAEALARSFRATDVVARYGGDEFAVLLPHARCDEIHERFESARRAVAQLEIQGRAGQAPLRLGLSVGFAVAPADGVGAAALLEIADRRLYEAKFAGRGCAVGPAPEAAPARAAAAGS
jgi:diguanylate cyclase (GGDEF)-like protein